MVWGESPCPAPPCNPCTNRAERVDPARAAGTCKGPRAQRMRLSALCCCQSSFVSLLRDLAHVVTAPTPSKGFLELVVERRGKPACGAGAWMQGEWSGAANPCPEGWSGEGEAAKRKGGFCKKQHARLCKPTWAGSSLWMAKRCLR